MRFHAIDGTMSYPPDKRSEARKGQPYCSKGCGNKTLSWNSMCVECKAQSMINHRRVRDKRRVQKQP